MSKRKPGARTDTGVVLFDVFYEDGGRASNRKVPASVLDGPGGDEAAMTFIMDQERKIAELSSKAPRPIKQLLRSN